MLTLPEEPHNRPLGFMAAPGHYIFPYVLTCQNSAVGTVDGPLARHSLHKGQLPSQHSGGQDHPHEALMVVQRLDKTSPTELVYNVFTQR